jgi:hypothetical protein
VISPFDPGLPPVSWGETLCSRRGCADLAVLVFDSWPYCLTCGEDAWERAVAWELNPELVGSMPALDDR